MKDQVKILSRDIFIFLVVLIAILALKIPIESLLEQNGGSEFSSHYLGGIPSRIIIIALSIYLIKKYGFSKVNGLKTPWKIVHFRPLFFPVVIFTVALFGSLHLYQDVPSLHVVIFLVAALLVGVAEELAFRGLLFPLIFRYTGRMTLAMILSSIVFGLSHYINLYKTPDNLYGINTQVIFAFSIGMFFCGLLLRTGNVYVVGLMHFFFNIAFGSGQVRVEKMTEEVTPGSEGSDLSSILFTLVLFALIAYSGIWMSKLKDYNHIWNKALMKNDGD